MHICVCQVLTTKTYTLVIADLIRARAIARGISLVSRYLGQRVVCQIIQPPSSVLLSSWWQLQSIRSSPLQVR